MEHDIEVTNETFDYYRYYDATAQAKFLFDCVKRYYRNIIPNEVAYLRKYETLKRFLEDK